MSDNNKNLPTQPNDGGGDKHYIDIQEFISKASTAVINGQEANIQPYLAARGYTDKELQAAKVKLDQLTALNQAQSKEQGEANQVYKDFDDEKAIAHPIYIDHLDIARIVFKNNVVAQKELHLGNKRKKSIIGYLTEALDFYNVLNGNAAYKAEIAKRGVTQAEISEGFDAYTKLAALNRKKKKEGGEAQMSTKVRDKAYDELDEWYSEFKTIGTIALRSVPQLREKLGWLER